MNYTKFDAADYLDSEEAIAAYLSAIMEENDPDLLIAALGDIARARGAMMGESTPPAREPRPAPRPAAPSVPMRLVVAAPTELAAALMLLAAPENACPPHPPRWPRCPRCWLSPQGGLPCSQRATGKRWPPRN